MLTNIILAATLLLSGCAAQKPGCAGMKDVHLLFETIRPEERWLDQSLERLIHLIEHTENKAIRAKMVDRFQQTIQQFTETKLSRMPTVQEDLFSSFTSAYLNLDLLDFEIEENRVTNTDSLRWRVIGGSAPRTDVPTLDDLAHAPYAIIALRVIAAVSGRPDPVLSAPNGRPVYFK